jgi:hypothetical protein
MSCAVAVVAAVDAARVLAERDRILADREFNPQPDWRARLLEWLGERFSDFAGFLSPGLSLVGLALLLVALVAVVFWLLPSAARGRAAAAAGAGSTAAPVRRLDAVELRGEARSALAQGRLADAIRFTWLAAVALLDRSGLSPARAARADWEHVDAVGRQRPQLVAPLSSLALEFQRTHFGKATPAREQADRCLIVLDNLEKELGG